MNEASIAPRGRLDSKRWHLLKDIVADALEEKSPAARTALVQGRCADDIRLRTEAESLVKEAETLLLAPTDFLEDCAEQATAALWQDESPRTGWRVGAYVIVRELGRGGMGAVYLAARADGQFEKEVAIKVLKRGTDTEEVLRRFASERHILARLDHPNIARLLDAGTTDDGLPYFVMEYVSGAPVTRFVRDHNLSIEDRLAIFLKVCSAVEVAHHNHIIHRDLKPSNILINEEGEAKLLDFGIAKLLGPGQDCLEITAAGEERLTPNCASPEQTDGRPVTEASDVYALGALLYEVLSGEKPHKFSSTHPPRDEIVRVIREEEPVALSAVVAERETGRKLRGDLDAIVTFAMRKEPEMRYHTVADLAADIRRHLTHEPVLARRGTAGYRARSFLARKRKAMGVIAAAAAALLAIELFIAYRNHSQSNTGSIATESPAVSPKSIAVLPFDNFGTNNPPSYFAEGVQDNILTDLGKVSDLKVISRSGVASYRGKTRNVKEIGRELGVANVLEGSVQISGDRVRINAQLIDTRTDTQIWAERYDRQVEDIFALQSELAQAIVAQLKATLTSQEKDAISKRPTQDLKAYDLYLQARAILNRVGPFDPKMNLGEAVKALDEAVARDPGFALAYCLLNEAHVYMYRFGPEHSRKDLDAARDSAETALRLQPKLEEARLAMARYYYNGLADYRQTLEQLSMVPAGPHEAEFYTIAGLAERRLARWADSVRDSEKALELDPRNSFAASNLMQTYSGLRRFADAERIGDATISQMPPKETNRLCVLKSEAHLGSGNLAAARVALQAAPVQEDVDIQVGLLWFCYLERDLAAAQKVIAAADESTKASTTYWLTLGAIARLTGDEEAARTAFEKVKELAMPRLQRRPEDPDLLGDVACADAGLGHAEEALREMKRVVDLAPVKKDALVEPGAAMRLAQVYAWTGDREAAIDLLGKLATVPFGANYGELKYSPMWDELRSDPRFEQMLADSQHSLLD